MIITYHTAYSTYEVDSDRKMVRRLRGANEPTLRQGEDGVWKAYETLLVESTGLVIIWGRNDDGSMSTTITSTVFDVEYAADDADA